MNIDSEKIKKAIEWVVSNYRSPELNGEITHAEVVRDAEYVITRDTLVELDVNFKQADKLARDHAGPPRERLQRCLEHLR